MRETFRDKDTVRVHPIMTKGGDLVNVIPNEAVIETLVRANNTEEILDASEKTDRAFLAGAVAVGAQVEIETMPGYLPTIPVDAPDEEGVCVFSGRPSHRRVLFARSY